MNSVFEELEDRKNLESDEEVSSEWRNFLCSQLHCYYHRLLQRLSRT